MAGSPQKVKQRIRRDLKGEAGEFSVTWLIFSLVMMPCVCSTLKYLPAQEEGWPMQAVRRRRGCFPLLVSHCWPF